MTDKNNIEEFAEASIVIIAHDILELDIIIPKLIFDYNINPNIKDGYYMYQNLVGNIITLNMNSIFSLKNENDIKTVIVYGFIHEIIHMHQEILSKYKIDTIYHTSIEDLTDHHTIDIIRNNIDLINSRLNFKFNDIFLVGVERQISISNNISPILFDIHSYFSKTLAGVLANKLNVNFDYLFNSLQNSDILTIIFPNKREYNIDLYYGQVQELNLLINLIYLTNFNMIHITINDFKTIEKRIVLRLL